MAITVKSIDRWLYAKGFTQPEVRRLMRGQLLIAFFGSCAAVLVTLGSAWGLAFAAGAGLITANFWVLARVAPDLMHSHKGAAVVAQMFLFYIRLALTGLALYVLIAWLRAPVTGLLFGLSTVLGNAVVWAFAGMKRKTVHLNNV